MKIVILLVVLNCLACSIIKNKKYNISTTTPPGTIKYNDSLFVDETEVSNVHWIDYQQYLKQRNLDYSLTIIDSNVWIDSLAINTPFKDHYLQHKAYRDYPLVGVSYKQAVTYCEWRSSRVNELLNIRKGLIEANHGLTEKELSKLPQYFKYRLPTKNEWEMFASVHFSSKIIRKRSKKNMNSIGNFETDSAYPIDITAPVWSYYPNINGIYNTHGNVKEMVLEKGIAKGGSWKTYENEYNPNRNFQYDKPTNDIGFRCVAEYIGSKKSSID